MSRQSRSVLLFIIFAFLPVIPIITSFYEIRSAVVLDKPMDWKEGVAVQLPLPAFEARSYEFRLESADSKWEPIIKADWKLFDGTHLIAQSKQGGDEWNLFRPFLTKKFSQPLTSPQLELTFLNSASEKHPIRLKVSYDRGEILEKHARLFIILLGFSLGFIVLIWKPFLTVAEDKNKPS